MTPETVLTAVGLLLNIIVFAVIKNVSDDIREIRSLATQHVQDGEIHTHIKTIERLIDRKG